MKTRHWVFCILLSGLLSATPQVAKANTAPDWECWIGTLLPVRIYCIRPPMDGGTGPLNYIHERLSRGEVQDLEKYVRQNRSLLEPGSVWSIRIISYPSVVSFEENRPVLLVRDLLCPQNPGCLVMVNPD
jgi:hypothetical protein